MAATNPELTRRLRWVLLVLAILVVVAIVLRSAVFVPIIGVLLLVAAAWALNSRTQ